MTGLGSPGRSSAPVGLGLFGSSNDHLLLNPIGSRGRSLGDLDMNVALQQRNGGIFFVSIESGRGRTARFGVGDN